MEFGGDHATPADLAAARPGADLPERRGVPCMPPGLARRRGGRPSRPGEPATSLPDHRPHPGLPAQAVTCLVGSRVADD